jgi:hypothetical protein
MHNVPIHPALVHVPVGLAAVLPAVALGLGLAIWKGALPRRTWWVVVGLQALMVGGAFAAMKTGEQEEKRVEERVDERFIEEHEERAEAFAWTAAGTLALSAGAALAPAPLLSAVLAAACLGTAADAGLALWTGKAGGELVYLHGAAGSGAAASGGTDDAAGERVAGDEHGGRGRGRHRGGRDDD